jgi:molybdate transport system substrate-binding protein
MAAFPYFRPSPVLIAFCGWLLLCGCGRQAADSAQAKKSKAVQKVSGSKDPNSQASESTPANVTPPQAAARRLNPKKQTEIVVLVAASAQEAMGDLAKGFSTEETTVSVSADDSSRLAQQIISGAPADLFLSASPKWVDAVEEKGLLVAKVPLLGNTLVVVSPVREKEKETSPPITIETLADSPKAKLAIAGPTVPAGIYGRQALKHYGWLERLEQQEQLVVGNNVREVLAYVERGEVELGIVYATDAKISKDVCLEYTFAEESHDPIVYPLALIKSESDHSDVARQFFEFLQSDQATDVYTKYGFKLLKK